MSPAAATISVNIQPFLNYFPKLNDTHRKNPYSNPTFHTFKKPYRISAKLEKTMAVESKETGIISGDGDEGLVPAFSAFEQEALIDNGVSIPRTVGGLHALFNRLSKWVVAITFCGLILLRHDALALWAAMGSVLNVILSVTLKKILKQERPVSGVSSGHGMPSSHAQSIFFITVFVIMSVIEWQGLNRVTAFLSMLVVALGLYFSWLRVLLRFHSTSQVVVGAVVGAIFSVSWLWAWETIIHKAYNSSLWLRIIIIVGAACFSLGFISHVLRHWIKDEHQ